LWKRSQEYPWLSKLNESETEELAHLHREVLDVEDIVTFRVLARVQLMAEEEAHRRANDVAGVRPRKSWWEWATGAEPEFMPASVDLGGVIPLSKEVRSCFCSRLHASCWCATLVLPPNAHARVFVLRAQLVAATGKVVCAALRKFKG
jgi:hypothetical protein